MTDRHCVNIRHPAGIMSNVAVQLYGQAVSIYHNQRIPLLFAFLGMGILGVSFAMNEE